MIRPRLRQRVALECSLCEQVFEGDNAVSLEQQVAAIDHRPDLFGLCLQCGQSVPLSDDASYRARVRSHVQWLKKQKAVMERGRKEMEATTEWPSDTKSLVGEVWLGWCPNDGSEMYANLKDRYECPSCRLQILVVGCETSVMSRKGMNDFLLRDGGRISAVDELSSQGAWPIKRDWRV